MNREETMKNFFEMTLRALFSGEKALEKALSSLADRASSDKLKKALRDHQQETVEQIKRLNQIFENIEISPTKSRVEEVEGVINKGKEVLKGLATWNFTKGHSIAENLLEQANHALEQFEKMNMTDYLIASGCQLIEEAEVVTYMSAITFSNAFGLHDVAKILNESLTEEKKALENMTKIAQTESESISQVRAGV